MLETAIVLLPLIGAAIAGLFGRAIGDRGAQVVTCVLLGVSAILPSDDRMNVVRSAKP